MFQVIRTLDIGRMIKVKETLCYRTINALPALTALNGTSFAR